MQQAHQGPSLSLWGGKGFPQLQGKLATSYSTFLCLSFLIYRMKLRTVSEWWGLRIKYDVTLNHLTQCLVPSKQIIVMISSSIWGFLGGSDCKESVCSAGTQDQSVVWEDLLEKGMATSIPAWEIPWTEELCGPQSWGLKESDTTEQLTLPLTI